jgi:hypothetical protein
MFESVFLWRGIICTSTRQNSFGQGSFTSQPIFYNLTFTPKVLKLSRKAIERQWNVEAFKRKSIHFFCTIPNVYLFFLIHAVTSKNIKPHTYSVHYTCMSQYMYQSHTYMHICMHTFFKKFKTNMKSDLAVHSRLVGTIGLLFYLLKISLTKKPVSDYFSCGPTLSL